MTTDAPPTLAPDLGALKELAAEDLDQRRLRPHRVDHRPRSPTSSSRPLTWSRAAGPGRRHRHRSRRPGHRSRLLRRTGIDYVPALVETARVAPRPRGSTSTSRVGDAEALPFEDDSLRLRPVRDRDHVHRRPPAGCRRDGPRDPPRRPDRAGQLDPDGLRRTDAQDRRRPRPSAPRRTASDPLGRPAVVGRLLGDAGAGRTHLDAAPCASASSAPSTTSTSSSTNYGPTLQGLGEARRARAGGLPGRPGRPGRGGQPRHRRHVRRRLGVPAGLRPQALTRTHGRKPGSLTRPRLLRVAGDLRAEPRRQDAAPLELEDRELPALAQVDRVHERPVQGLGLECGPTRTGPGAWPCRRPPAPASPGRRRRPATGPRGPRDPP